MQKFNGMDMLKIDLANCYGLDKSTWNERLTWVEDNKNCLRQQISDAKEPYMFQKALLAYEGTLKNIPSGHNMFLDATSSVLQIMAALSGCHHTAYAVNLINSDERKDVYTDLANSMNKELDSHDKVDRKLVKKPMMTHFYNKMVQDTLNDNQKLIFYKVLSDSFPGAEAVKNIINQCWDKTATHHTWILPDGHVAKVNVTEMCNVRIAVNELDGSSFTYRYEKIACSDRTSSLAPNVIHSIDAYIVRELVHQAYDEGFQVAHIHDSFTTHPNNMQRVRELYTSILAKIANSNLLSNIVSDILNKTIQLSKFSNNLGDKILLSDYALS